MADSNRVSRPFLPHRDVNSAVPIIVVGAARKAANRPRRWLIMDISAPLLSKARRNLAIAVTAFVLAVAVDGIAARPALADDGWHRGYERHGWREHEWRGHAWRGHEWREHEWREHRYAYYAPGYYPGYYYVPGYVYD